MLSRRNVLKISAGAIFAWLLGACKPQNDGITPTLTPIDEIAQKTEETGVIDQKVIEKVAKISAMFDINEDIAVDMLKKEEISAQEYRDIITAIALDEITTNTFVQMKKIHAEEFQKQ